MLRIIANVAVCMAAVVFAPAVTAGQTEATWGTQADSLRGRNGQRFTYACPAGGQLSSRVWGTDVYTDDSSICTAAVHAGLITAARGGVVTIEIRPAASSYRASSRNGVASRAYGGWHGSFAFAGGGGEAGVIQATWDTQADSLRGRNGQRFTYRCPSGGRLSPRLWGTDFYTDDSSICTAAVHAGFINAAGGGKITIEIRPGASTYRGSSRNGVTSKDYGSHPGSFAVVASGSEGSTEARPANWSTQSDSLRGRNGQRFAFACTAGGQISSRVWGTDLYTDDSSICTAAVHAGLITAASGGVVMIEIRPGAPSYRGSSRNGVTSGAYGSWHGSFAFVR